MKKTLLLLLMALAAFSANAQRGKNAPLTPPLKNAIDSANYAYGVVLATSTKRQMGTDLNVDALVAGLRAALKGDSTLLTVDQSNTIFSDYNRQAQVRATEAAKKSGMQFLEENKKRPGVVTTPSGLQYQVLVKGTGTVSPKATDKVKVHYHGTNVDGSVFDSSVDRGQPITFGLGQVIKGWTEGLQLMHVGDKFKLFIPSELAYGERSPSPKIKPNAVLIFDVELLEINPAN